MHRQLLAAVGEGERETLPGNTRLAELTQHMNTQHRVIDTHCSVGFMDSHSWLTTAVQSSTVVGLQSAQLLLD